MSKEEKKLQFDNISRGVADGSINSSIWVEMANRELEDNKVGVPDTLTVNELNEIYNRYNAKLTPIRVNFTAFLTERGGRTNPILNGYRPRLKIDNTKYETDCVFQLGNDVLYPGDSHSFIMLLLKPNIPIQKGMTFGIFEGQRKIGQGLLI